MADNDKKCVFCEKSGNEVPLITLDFQDKNFWICPQHMPVLIHSPGELIGKLPGAENMEPGKPDH